MQPLILLLVAAPSLGAPTGPAPSRVSSFLQLRSQALRVQGAGNSSASASSSSSTSAKAKCNIFTLWDYPHGAPLFARLNLESWRRHSHGRCNEPVLINDTNVREYIPDMPDEYFRMPYPAAKSDLIRYALIYHHGGIYMDSDFVAVKDMDPLIGRLADHDLVSYGNRAGCSSFSSNLLGGRRGSKVHGEVWKDQKKLVSEHCSPRERTKEKVCCFDGGKEVCHVPWAGLGEWVSHRKLTSMRIRKVPLKMFCFAGAESFTPEDIGNVLQHKDTDLAGALQEFQQKRVEKPLGRIMYHLFNGQFPLKDYNCSRLFDNTTFTGALYTKSFASGRGGAAVPLGEGASRHPC